MGTALRSRSELPEVMLRLEVGTFLAERFHLRALHGEVRTGQCRAEGPHEAGGGLQPIERRAQRGRVPMDPALAPLIFGEGARIDEHRLARLELARDAVEPPPEETAPREVGVRPRVRRLD